MKKIILISSAVLLLSGKKESEVQRFQKKISGVWEQERGTGLITVSYPPGNGQIVAVKGDGGHERRKHDTLVFSEAYTLTTKTDRYPGANSTLMQTTDGASFYVDLENENLVFSSSNCVADGGGAFYRRIQ